MPRYNIVMPDIVALVVIVAMAALTWNSNVSSADFKDAVILVLGYVFGTGKGTILK